MCKRGGGLDCGGRGLGGKQGVKGQKKLDEGDLNSNMKEYFFFFL